MGRRVNSVISPPPVSVCRRVSCLASSSVVALLYLRLLLLLLTSLPSILQPPLSVVFAILPHLKYLGNISSLCVFLVIRHFFFFFKILDTARSVARPGRAIFRTRSASISCSCIDIISENRETIQTFLFYIIKSFRSSSAFSVNDCKKISRIVPTLAFAHLL